jgi:hypothetical protein
VPANARGSRSASPAHSTDSPEGMRSFEAIASFDSALALLLEARRHLNGRPSR